MTDEPGVVKRNRPFAEDIVNRLVEAERNVKERDLEIRKHAVFLVSLKILLKSVIIDLDDDAGTVSICFSKHSHARTFARLMETHHEEANTGDRDLEDDLARLLAGPEGPW